MAKDVEIRTRLKLDDQASGALDRIKSAFGGVNDAQQGTQQSMGFMKSMLSTFAAVNLAPAARGVFGFAKSFFDSANAANDADQALAGLITTMQGLPWSESRAQAESLGDELDRIAINAGQSMDDVGSAFQVMMEITGATTSGIAKAKNELTKMTTIANVLGKSTTSIAQEFSFMQDGIVRTRGTMFQLLKQTGIFGDNVKEAATEWAKLTDEERSRALSSGLDQIAGKLGKATPTLTDLTTSLKNMWQVAKEKLGDPLIRELIPVLQGIVKEFDGAMGGIDGLAKALSKDVARWVKEAAGAIQNGFEWIKTHQEEIRNAISDGVAKARALVEFILANKEAIAIAFGARAGVGIASMVANSGMGQGIAGIAKKGAAGTGTLVGGGAGLTGVAGGALALGAFTAAIAAAAAAVDQFAKLMKETGGGKGEKGMEHEAITSRFEEMAKNPSFEAWGEAEHAHFTRMRENIVNLAQEMGKNSRAAGELADKAFAAHVAARRTVEPIEKMAEVLAKLEGTGGTEGIDMGPMVEQFSTGFTNAINAGNMGAAQYMANILGGAKGLHSAFLNSSGLTAEGFETLAGMLEGKSKEFADKLRNLAASEGAGGAVKPAAPKISMSGGQVFKIQQDFRDQDPDRVAVVFERDVAAAAERRVSAVTSSPFGT